MFLRAVCAWPSNNKRMNETTRLRSACQRENKKKKINISFTRRTHHHYHLTIKHFIQMLPRSGQSYRVRVHSESPERGAFFTQSFS